MLVVFAAAALASDWLPKGFSHSGKTEVSTQQIAQRVFPGVEPISAWQCPSTHIIKGNFTPSSGERCIYHVPGGAFYDKTKPEKCYVSHEDATADGCRSPSVSWGRGMDKGFLPEFDSGDNHPAGVLGNSLLGR